MHKLHTLNYPLPLDLFVHITIARIAAKKKLLQMSRYKNIQNGNRDKRCKRLCLLSIYEC